MTSQPRQSAVAVPDPKQRIFGQRIAARRQRRNLSLREAAAEIGVSASTVLRLERGEVDATVIKVVSWLRDDDTATELRARAEYAEEQLRALRQFFDHKVPEEAQR